jgi:hypothetical protein
MYQGNGHVHKDKFNRVSDFQDRYYRDPTDSGARPGTEYRSSLRNQARLAYRLAKKTLKQVNKQSSN